MKRKTEKSLDERRCIVAYLDSVHARLASHKGMISLRELQSETQEELDALMPSVLDKTFNPYRVLRNGEL